MIHSVNTTTSCESIDLDLVLRSSSDQLITFYKEDSELTMASSNAPASQSTYDEYTATSTTRQTTGPSLNLPYVKSIPGIIKIAEIVSDAKVCILQP